MILNIIVTNVYRVIVNILNICVLNLYWMNGKMLSH